MSTPEDGLQSLGDAMPANLLGDVAGHQTDDQSADHGNDDHPKPERASRRRSGRQRELVVEEEVGKPGDELQVRSPGLSAQGSTCVRTSTLALDVASGDRRIVRRDRRLLRATRPGRLPAG